MNCGDDFDFTLWQAVWEYYINANVTLSGLRIRWAQTGVEFDANGCGQYTDTLANSSLEFCQTGIYANNGNLTINNSTRCSVATPVSSYYGCTTITGSLTDIGSVYSGGNHLPDSVEYQYFGRLGTLQGYEVQQLTNHIFGHDVSTNQAIWLTRDDTNGIYQYNTTNWLAGVQGLSAFSVWHTPFYDGQGNYVNGWKYGGTLITPRHALYAAHAPFPDNTVVRFVGTDNILHQVTCLHSEAIPNTDIAIMVFDQDLPSSVGYAPILSSGVSHKLTPNMYLYIERSCPSGVLPIVAFNQRKEAYIEETSYLNERVDIGPSSWIPTWGSYCYRSGGCIPDTELENGDSGSPAFLLINNQLVLIGSNWYPAYFYSPVFYVDQINSAIADLDNWVSTNDTWVPNPITHDTVTVSDLSGFPDLW